MKKVTLNDVAKKAGVSPKTASRVINREPSVSQSKRDAVNRVVELLGYRPNTSARSLRSQRAYVVALLYDNLSPAYVLDLQVGVMSACKERGYNLLVQPCDYESNSLVDMARELLDNQRVDGFILSPPICDHKPLIEMLIEQKSEFVRIAPVDNTFISPYVSADDKKSSEQMTDYLLSLGHRRIGFISGDVRHQSAKERLLGYQQALRAAGIALEDELVVYGDFSFESGERWSRKLLQLKNPPSAIFASNDYMAAGVLKTAQKMGLSVPDQLSITGFDNAPVSKQLWPTLTTIKQPVMEIAAVSAELLLNCIHDDKFDPIHVRKSCKMVLRESTSEHKIR